MDAVVDLVLWAQSLPGTWHLYFTTADRLSLCQRAKRRTDDLRAYPPSDERRCADCRVLAKQIRAEPEARGWLRVKTA